MPKSFWIKLPSHVGLHAQKDRGWRGGGVGERTVDQALWIYPHEPKNDNVSQGPHSADWYMHSSCISAYSFICLTESHGHSKPSRLFDPCQQRCSSTLQTKGWYSSLTDGIAFYVVSPIQPRASLGTLLKEMLLKLGGISLHLYHRTQNPT